MIEWKLTPEYIMNNWTYEEFSLMVDSMIERKNSEMAAVKPKPVSDSSLFNMAGIKVKKVKRVH